METIQLKPQITTFVESTLIQAKIGKAVNFQINFSQEQNHLGWGQPKDFNRAYFEITTEFSLAPGSGVLLARPFLPTGLSINAAGILSGSFVREQANGYFKVTFTQNGSVMGVIEINISKADPVLLLKNVRGSTLQDFNQAFTFISSNNVLDGTITSAEGLPPGLYFEAGKLKGRAISAGTFKVKVFINNSAQSEVITIQVCNAAPSISTNELPSGKAGVGYSAQLFIADSNSPADSWVASGLPTGLIFSNGKISGSPTQMGTFSPIFTVTNVIGSSSKVLALSIAAGSPVIPYQFISAKIGELFSQPIISENSANRPTTSWTAAGLPDWATLNASTGRVSGTPHTASKQAVTIIATGPGGSASAQVDFFVRESVVGKFGEVVSFTPGKFDARTASAWAATDLPAGLSINPTTGEITGTPAVTGSILSQIRITLDGVETITRAVYFYIAFGTPIILPEQKLAARLGFPFSDTPALADTISRPASSWSASGLPAWAVFNSATGEITGSPDEYAESIATIIATGPGGVSSATEITVDVSAGAPILLSNQVFPAKVGTAFAPVVPASVDSDNRPINSWVATMPAGLSLHPTTGEITGTPTISKTFRVKVTASGPSGISTSIIVFVIALGSPAIAPDQNCVFPFGNLFTKTFSLLNEANRPVSSWSATGLPAGASLNTDTGTLTVESESTGITIFTLTATGPGGEDSQNLTLSITPGKPLIAPGQIISGPATASLSLHPETLDVINRPIERWSATGLPVGVSISATTGEISGIPAVFWEVPATITVTGPGGSSSEKIDFRISRLPQTSKVKIIAASNVFPIAVSGSLNVQVFSSNLVRVDQDYIVPKVDELFYADQFAPGTHLLVNSPAIDGLFVHREPSRKDNGDGFMKFSVTAYGRTSLDWKESQKLVLGTYTLGRSTASFSSSVQVSGFIKQSFFFATTLSDVDIPFSLFSPEVYDEKMLSISKIPHKANFFYDKKLISFNQTDFGRFKETEIVINSIGSVNFIS